MGDFSWVTGHFQGGKDEIFVISMGRTTFGTSWSGFRWKKR
jgi:hypothetical protein